MDPVGIMLMFTASWAPRRMIEPLPNCRSICATAVSRALSFSWLYSVMVTPLSWGSGVDGLAVRPHEMLGPLLASSQDQDRPVRRWRSAEGAPPPLGLSQGARAARAAYQQEPQHSACSPRRRGSASR